MFKLDFEALYIYFAQKEISYLKKYIPGSQTALVSCKNMVQLTARPDQTAQIVSVMIDGYDFQIWKLITMSHVSADLLVQSAFQKCRQEAGS